jgi:hypothetical protein
MNISAKLTDWYLHWWLGLPQPTDGPQQCSRPKEPEMKPHKIDDRVKYTTQGIAYREEQPEGCEVSAWQVVSYKAGKGNSALMDAEQVAGRQKGFNVDTMRKVKALWAEGITQSEIVRRSGYSMSTVKKLCAGFSKHKKTVQKGSN